MGDWESLKGEGDAAYRANRFDAAVKQYGAALVAAADPASDCASRHVLLSNRAAARLALGDFAAALRDAEACVACKPQWAKGFGRKGAALFGLREFSRASIAYQAVSFMLFFISII
jgi:stress-induced-phosphoprotein 1|tara:strand:+ start:57 stop:404 length:348 start_codon:yes stop_codon:yes gene_type:complete